MPDVESDPLIRFCRDYLADVDPDIDYFVMGHRHIQFDYPLNSRSRLVLLGEWINQDSYAVFDGKELKLKVYGK
jgi:UDP-2,3-diacylglucosamine hydrolase